jgi:succinyl-CoA synthetase alpha subunit
MSILIDAHTRVLIQGITGGQARVDTERSLRYGVHVVAGVTPGRGGDSVHGVPVYDTVKQALAHHIVDVSVIYVPAAGVKAAVLEALDASVPLLLVTAEFVPLHDVVYVVAATKDAGARLIGCNTNGMIAPGKSRLGGIGGENPSELYVPGTIGVCSRSGGMCAEIGLTLQEAGLGISTCVAMGGDLVTGMRMAEYVALFETDAQTHAIVLFGEPGTRNEQEVAELVRAGKVSKPIVALIAGAFQERHPPGVSFGHAAAMITDGTDSASAKRRVLAEVGIHVAQTLEDIVVLLKW